MKKAFYLLVLAFFALSGYSGDALATSFDYGDAPGYGEATHFTPDWQRLGTAWDAEPSQNLVDTSDDGVSWSVDGANWGNETLYVGQTVQFRFDLH